jgi:hypothetical protein
MAHRTGGEQQSDAEHKRKAHRHFPAIRTKPRRLNLGGSQKQPDKSTHCQWKCPPHVIQTPAIATQLLTMPPSTWISCPVM